jgi:hypothetical protein
LVKRAENPVTLESGTKNINGTQSAFALAA